MTIVFSHSVSCFCINLKNHFSFILRVVTSVTPDMIREPVKRRYKQSTLTFHTYHIIKLKKILYKHMF